MSGDTSEIERVTLAFRVPEYYRTPVDFARDEVRVDEKG
jgi:hypothetical protein